MKKYLLAYRFFRRHSLSQDEKRNLRLGGVVSIYGISFAVEKLCIVIGHPLADFWWFVIYGTLALISLIWWIEDIILDMWEHHTTEDDELYGSMGHLKS